MALRRSFRRQIGREEYRRLFIISTEGSLTEIQYFSNFNDNLSIHICNCLRAKKNSSPEHVLKRMEMHLQQLGLKSGDEAWLVIDKDQWSDEQINNLFHWAQKKDNHGFALSNPHFEYWLLLHFEGGGGIRTSRECNTRLKKYLPGYDKSIDMRKIRREMIENAIRRAKHRDTPPCTDWPRSTGSTVYKLVEKLLQN